MNYYWKTKEEEEGRKENMKYTAQ